MQLRIKKSMKRNGFTLIEIIVSVTLLLLLSGLFVANYTGFNNPQTVSQSVSDVIMNLQAARTKAVSGVKPALCVTLDTLVGYRVDFTATGSTYTVQARCLVSGSEQGVGEIMTYTLPSGVKFSPIPFSMTFYALDRGASADQTISIVGNGVTKKVSVFKSGVISNFIATP
jgi:prepilin-type N-terminal cleavage/methylation domain-containing protein